MTAAWWFTPHPKGRIAALRVLLYAFVWFDVFVYTEDARHKGDVPGRFYHPLHLAELLHLPTPTHRLVTSVVVALLAASALALTGRAPRLLGAAVAVLYLEWMLIAWSYGKVDHDRFSIVIALFVLPTVGAARLGDGTPDERAGWAVRCVQVAVVATYLLAAVAKYRFGHGLEWLDSTTLLRAVVRRGTFLADPLLHAPWILHATQYLIVGLELASPLLLLDRPRRLRLALVGVFLAFHAMTYATLTISFLPHVLCLVGAFLPLEKLRARDLRPGQLLVGPDVAR